jgi:hypothetical protein
MGLAINHNQQIRRAWEHPHQFQFVAHDCGSLAFIGDAHKEGVIEQEMLECALEPNANSRLGCQVIINDELDGLVIHLPKAQY